MTSTFIDSLVQDNLQSVMQQLEDVDTFLESLKPEISKIAYSMMYSSAPRAVDVDDLIQTGLIAAWQALELDVTHTNPKSFCIARARWRMKNFLRGARKQDAESLDQWLQPSEDNGKAVIPHDIECVAPIHPMALDEHHAKKHMVWAILSNLPKKYQAVLTAQYLTRKFDGHAVTVQGVKRRYKLTNDQFIHTKRNALRMARRTALKVMS
jgi:RNA polymerase sigma factor (sigma-70 family)